MDAQTLTAIAALVSALSWPITVLIVIFAFRGLITAWLKLPSSLERRSIRAKAGEFEVELSAIEKIQERVQETALKIAEEPDLKKRLALAQNLRIVDTILPKVLDVDIDALAEFQKASISNAKLVDFWKLNAENRAMIDTYNRLEGLGLIRLENYYEGQCVAVLTELGRTLLHSLSETHVGIESTLQTDRTKE